MQHLVELASAVVIAGTGEDLTRGSASLPGTGRRAAGAVIEHNPGRPRSLAGCSSWIGQALHLVQMATGKGMRVHTLLLRLPAPAPGCTAHQGKGGLSSGGQLDAGGVIEHALGRSAGR